MKKTVLALLLVLAMALPIAAMAAAQNDLTALLVPRANAEEAALAAGGAVAVYPLDHLRDAVAFFQGRKPEARRASSMASKESSRILPSFH